MAIGLITSQDASRAEDVVDIITNVAYKSTPLYSGLGSGTAQNTLHEWLTDTYATSAGQAIIEGSDATVVDLTPPVRNNNVVQMFRKVVQVSDTERAVHVHGGVSDPYTFQTQKAMVELARDIEKALVAGTRASGSSGVARALDGVIAQISSNATARNSGTSLSETEFNDIMAGVWNSGTDQFADEVYVGSYLKRVITGYTAGATKFLQAADQRLTNSVDVYEGDFGIHKIFLHREVPIAAGSAALVAIDSRKWRVDYLQGRRPQHVPLSKTGSATKGMLEGELTLVGLSQASSAKRTGYFVG